MNFSEFTEAAETFIIGVINERNHDRKAQILRMILFVLSRVYRRAVQFRHWVYEKRIIRQKPLGCFVVSIGNLTCGGTGKTPVVEIFSRALSNKGRKVAVLSRGYRSRDRSAFEKFKALLLSKKHQIPPRVVSDGENLLLNSDTAGDEPFMLASNLGNVIVLVDKDRVKSGLYAISEFGADTLVLDDGFQYLDLKPRLNIVLVDATLPFHNHHVLPRGLLREPIKNLRRADYIFLTKSNGGRHIRHLKKFIGSHNPRAEIIECNHKPKHLENVFVKGERHGLEAMKGKRIAALSGIASPEGFEEFLVELGGTLVHKERFADHHRYTQQELIDFINKAKSSKAQMVVTTEKDAVRIPKLERRDIPVYFLRVEIEILSGRENFEQCVSRICFM